MAYIAGKQVEVTPLTWAEHKKLMLILGESFTKIETMLRSGEGMPSNASLLQSMPEVVTAALALGLRLPSEEVDKATLEEVLEAIEEVVKINKLAENFKKIKNLKGLLVTPGKGPDLKAAAQEVRDKIASLKKPSLLSSAIDLVGLKRK